jgi:hypothetical protein
MECVPARDCLSEKQQSISRRPVPAGGPDCQSGRVGANTPRAAVRGSISLAT